MCFQRGGRKGLNFCVRITLAQRSLVGKVPDQAAALLKLIAPLLSLPLHTPPREVSTPNNVHVHFDK